MYAIRVTLTDGREGWWSGSIDWSECEEGRAGLGKSDAFKRLDQEEADGFVNQVGMCVNVASARVVPVELREVGT